MIRNVQIPDAEQIATIYNYYVKNSIVTFDKDVFTRHDFEERIKIISKEYPFIVYEKNNIILGYAYANKWREKPAYKHTVESTVYLKPSAFGKKIGTQLYKHLIDKLKTQKFKVIIGGLSLPNDASIKLHEKLGFKKVGHFKKVGKKFGKLIDVGFWQLNIND